MKKLFLFLAFTCLYLAGNAQSMKLQSAISDLKNSRLDRAKTNIDEASEHESTKDEAKTWRYKASIYYELATTTKDKFKGLAENPLQTAYESAIKSIQLDTEKEFLRENIYTLRNISTIYYNEGIDCFEKKDFQKAYGVFTKAAAINKASGDRRGMLDAYYNAAIAAQNVNDTTNAMKIYKELTNYDYPNSKVYIILYQNYKKHKDTINAISIAEKSVAVSEKVFNEAKAAGQTVTQDFIPYLTLSDAYNWIGNKDKAIVAMNKALAIDPQNPVVLNSIGITLEGNGDFEGAKARYTESLTIKPEQYEANYNLGALYYNRAADKVEAANKVPYSDETGLSNKLREEARQNFASAIPYLEKAISIKPNDGRALGALRECYAQTEDEPYTKMKAVIAKMKELGLIK